MNVIPNAFLDNLKDDFVAVAPNGTIVGRADTKEALERAHGADAVTILDAAGVNAAPTIAEAATAKLDDPLAAVVAQGVVEPAPGGIVNDTVVEPEAPTAEEQIAKMDPDGDGKIGGAPKGGNRKKAAASK